MDLDLFVQLYITILHQLTFGAQHALQSATSGCDLALHHERISISACKSDPVIITFLVSRLPGGISVTTNHRIDLIHTFISTSPDVDIV